MLWKTVSNVILVLLVTSILVLAVKIQPVEASGTIYIRADGSIDPPTAPIATLDNVTYTLTGNITSDADGIVVERDNIVVDGAGYTVQGAEIDGSDGIDLSGRSNMTIRNTTIRRFYYGICSNYTNEVTIIGNNIACREGGTRGDGIHLYSSSNNDISGNNIINSSAGISLNSSSNVRISRNNITISVAGIDLDSSSNVDISQNNITAADADGIWFWTSSDNSITGNIITNNSKGIEIETSSNNTISGNIITNNSDGGIQIMGSNNSITGNNITNNENGIWFWKSSDSSITGNIITNNSNGIEIETSSNNIIAGNNLRDNEVGILFDSSNNKIYHNNFVNNLAEPIFLYRSSNTWDNGYPSGGNYWSDCNAVDLCRGTYQNETGNDGIGDTPYVIDAKNLDRYPLMTPWYQISGDIDFDGKVSLADLVLLANAYGSKLGDSKWNPDADIDGNGRVGLADLTLLAIHYGQHNP